MNKAGDTSRLLFDIADEAGFNRVALEIFRHQYDSVALYRQFSDGLNKNPGNISSYIDIPFIPISFFKDHRVLAGSGEAIGKIFYSSGTTGSVPSRHYVCDLELYEESFLKSFSFFYGRPDRYRFLALLPGYLEREGSSLVYMMDRLISMTRRNGSGFFLHDMDKLRGELTRWQDPQGVTTILFGVSYALLDFAHHYPAAYENVIVMETGGMKGRQREMIREELHQVLAAGLGVEVIHSEYGMTELLSQAYSQGNGAFRSPPWMKVLIRDINDPLELMGPGKTGGINVIDLANLYSCSFIATQDLGRMNDDGSFEVLGRFDDSDIRGCNLLI